MLDAIASARAIVIGPSNPVISIRPILDVPGMANALRAAPAPVVAVSPIVGGEVLKGPTEAFMDWAGLTLDAAGVAAPTVRARRRAARRDPRRRAGRDSAQAVGGVPVTVAPTLMDDPERRRDVAAAALELAGRSCDERRDPRERCTMSVVVVLPVKELTRAKARLGESGVGPAARVSLATGMLTDVFEALDRSRLVDDVVVVSARPARRGAGALATATR